MFQHNQTPSSAIEERLTQDSFQNHEIISPNNRNVKNDVIKIKKADKLKVNLPNILGPDFIPGEASIVTERPFDRSDAVGLNQGTGGKVTIGTVDLKYANVNPLIKQRDRIKKVYNIKP